MTCVLYRNAGRIKAVKIGARDHESSVNYPWIQFLPPLMSKLYNQSNVKKFVWWLLKRRLKGVLLKSNAVFIRWSSMDKVIFCKNINDQLPYTAKGQNRRLFSEEFSAKIRCFGLHVHVINNDVFRQKTRKSVILASDKQLWNQDS